MTLRAAVAIDGGALPSSAPRGRRPAAFGVAAAAKVSYSIELSPSKGERAHPAAPLLWFF
jgi:hypothetical protein